MQSLSSLRLKKSQSGVYKLFDSQKNLIYIGKSYNLKQRIYSSARRNLLSSYVSFMLISDKRLVDLFEVYLINKYKPIINRSIIPNNKFISQNFSKIDLQEDFSDLIEIDTEQKIKFGFGSLIKKKGEEEINLICKFLPTKDEVELIPKNITVSQVNYLSAKRVYRNQ